MMFVRFIGCESCSGADIVSEDLSQFDEGGGSVEIERERGGKESKWRRSPSETPALWHRFTQSRTHTHTHSDTLSVTCSSGSYTQHTSVFIHTGTYIQLPSLPAIENRLGLSDHRF